MGKKSHLIVALIVALVLNGAICAYAHTTATSTINTAQPSGDIATVAAAPNQPNWSSVLPQPGNTTENATQGAVPTGNLFEVTPAAGYSGDLMVKVYLTNAGALIEAYQCLNMGLYLEGSAEASETPNYRLLTLDNGSAAFDLTNISGAACNLSIIGGSYSLVSDNSSLWHTGWSVTPALYCEVTQR